MYIAHCENCSVQCSYLHNLTDTVQDLFILNAVQFNSGKYENRIESSNSVHVSFSYMTYLF
jgi:hypothetical protein